MKVAVEMRKPWEGTGCDSVETTRADRARWRDLEHEAIVEDEVLSRD